MMDEMFLNKRPTMMCLAKEKKEKKMSPAMSPDDSLGARLSERPLQTPDQH